MHLALVVITLGGCGAATDVGRDAAPPIDAPVDAAAPIDAPVDAAAPTDAVIGVDAPFDSGPEPVYEPLVCDETRSAEIALGFQWVNDWSDHLEHQRHGRIMLLVDGSCRFYASHAARDLPSMRTGMLDAALLADINAELMTGPWASIDGVHARGETVDSAWMAVWRDGIGGSCEGHLGCVEGTPERLARLVSTADAWVDRLHAVGVEVTGRVRLYAWSGELVGTVRRTWTGATPLATLFDGIDLTYGVRLDHAEDAALLRAMRGELGADQQLALEEDGMVWTVQVLDETPFHDERGYLRPPFAVPGAPTR
jgi:hypothetical protein